MSKVREISGGESLPNKISLDKIIFTYKLLSEIKLSLMAKKPQEKVNYSNVVTSIVDEKLYFKDAMDWYCMKYLNATSERTFYILLSIMSFIIVIFLYLTIKSILPLKEKFPVLVRQKDSVKYYTTIEPLKPAKMNYNSNEAILRFLLINYVRNLFEHDYKTGNIEDLNNKLAKVKLYSTDNVYQKYRDDFNVVSAEMFNKKVDQKVALKSFSFVKTKEKNNKDKFLNYLFSKIPSEAEITYRTIFTNYSTGERKISDAKIHLTFKYESISYNNIKKEFTKPILVITDYRIIDDNKNNKKQKSDAGTSGMINGKSDTDSKTNTSVNNTNTNKANSKPNTNNDDKNTNDGAVVNEIKSVDNEASVGAVKTDGDASVNSNAGAEAQNNT